MSNIPADLMYTSDDEWVKIEGNIATIGITDYAQDQLSDIVYLGLPAVGDVIAVGEAFGVVESVKAASDMYAPLSGTVAEVNEALVEAPEAINDEVVAGEISRDLQREGIHHQDEQTQRQQHQRAG